MWDHVPVCCTVIVLSVLTRPPIPFPHTLTPIARTALCRCDRQGMNNSARKSCTRCKYGNCTCHGSGGGDSVDGEQGEEGLQGQPGASTAVASDEAGVELQGTKQATHSVGKPELHCSKCT